MKERCVYHDLNYSGDECPRCRAEERHDELLEHLSTVTDTSDLESRIESLEDELRESFKRGNRKCPRCLLFGLTKNDYEVSSVCAFCHRDVPDGHWERVEGEEKREAERSAERERAAARERQAKAAEAERSAQEQAEVEIREESAGLVAKLVATLIFFAFLGAFGLVGYLDNKNKYSSPSRHATESPSETSEPSPQTIKPAVPAKPTSAKPVETHPPVATTTEPEIYVAGSGVIEPQIIYQTIPGYTEEACKNRIQGIVQIQAVVCPDGSLEKTKVIKSLGYGLDESALREITKWKFKPGMLADRPVYVKCVIEISFRLL